MGIWTSWGVIVLCVGLTVLATLRGNRKRTEVLPDPTGPDPFEAVDPDRKHEPVDPEKVTSGPLKMSARYLIGARHLATGASGDARQFADQIRQAAAESPVDRLRAVPAIVELEGSPAAHAELDKLPFGPGHPLYPDVQSLRVIYTQGPEALDPAAREALRRRHGWFADLALTFGKPPDDPARRAVIEPARKVALLVIGGFIFGVLVFLAGCLLLVTGIVLFFMGKLRLAYSQPPPVAGYPHAPWPPYYPPLGAYPYGPAYQPMYPPPGNVQGYWPPYRSPYGSPYAAPFTPLPPVPPPAAAPTEPAVPDRLASPRTAPFLEAFALYLASHIVLSLMVHFVFKTSNLAMNWLMVPLLPVLVLWPVWRGVKWSDVRRGLGLHKGKGVLREAGAGVLGYVAGLPVFVLGVFLTTLLTRLGDAAPSHPLQFEVGKSWLTNLHLYLLACVWAPVTEELMFRGSLFHHLRRRWNWLISATLVSLIFAAIHPQGWAAIPALGSLALVFAAVREWRSSLVGPMVGHFIQNFVVTTVMILMMG